MRRLAEARSWETFAIVGHSMSTLAAIHLAQHHPARVARAVVIAPPPLLVAALERALGEGPRA